MQHFRFWITLDILRGKLMPYLKKKKKKSFKEIQKYLINLICCCFQIIRWKYGCGERRSSEGTNDSHLPPLILPWQHVGDENFRWTLAATCAKSTRYLGEMAAHPAAAQQKKKKKPTKKKTNRSRSQLSFLACSCRPPRISPSGAKVLSGISTAHHDCWTISFPVIFGRSAITSACVLPSLIALALGCKVLFIQIYHKKKTTQRSPEAKQNLNWCAQFLPFFFFFPSNERRL